jgi:hypothetical protein
MITKKILLITFTALLLRLGFIFLVPQEKVLSGDQVQYETIAMNITTGHGFSLIPGVPTPRRAPAYPYFLTLVYLVFGHSFTAVRVLQVVLSALTCTLLYKIAREISDESTAAIAAWLLVVYWPLYIYCGALITETIFTFLLAVFALFLMKWLRGHSFKHALVSGAFLGLAAMTRPVVLYLPLIVLIYVLITSRKLIAHSAMFLLAFLAVCVPWSVRNYTLFGITAPCSIGTGFGMYMSGNLANGLSVQDVFDKAALLGKEYPEDTVFVPKHSNAVEQEKRMKAEGLALIKAHKAEYFMIVLKRLPGFWISSHSSLLGIDKSIPEYIKARDYLPVAVRLFLLSLQAALVLLAFRGIFLARHDPGNYAMIFILLIYFTGHITFDYVPRYQLPAMPYLLIFTALAISSFMKRHSSKD